MFNFFTKKEFLVDHLAGFIDIHNHILPGIDDGAKNVEESIELIKGFKEFGVTKFICTPHIMHNYYDNTPKTIKESFKELKKGVNHKELKDIMINYAAEHMIDDNFENILNTEKTLALGTNHLLIEMSYLQPSINFDTAVERITQKQLFPVFAHPERYLYLHKDYNLYTKFKSQGILFQLNMLSLSEYYGKDIQAITFKLLDEGKYDFIGSDVHNLKHLNFIKNEVKIDKKRVDKINKIINNTIATFY